MTTDLGSFFFRLLQDPLRAICGNHLIWPIIRLYYRRQFLKFGHSTIFTPTRILGAKYISIGDGTVIDQYCEISAIPLNSTVNQAIIEIGNGCVINQFNRIGAVSSVKLGDNVLLASNIFISDSEHQYRDVSMPIMKQPWICRGPVVIESGCWLGDGVKVLGGVTIGENCVIGANSVVNRSIPPFSVAAGAPALVLSRWDHETSIWTKEV